MGPIMEMPAGDKDEGTGMAGAEKGSTGSANSPAVHPEKAVRGNEILRDITSLVRGEAVDIAGKLLEAAKSGQLAHARYLFEVAGIYPKVDESAESGSGESLTYRLMKELGLPAEPGIAAGDHATSDGGKNEQRVTDASDEDGRLLN
jgi:hypothetical protein